MAWVALATLLGTGTVEAIPSSSPMNLKARHQSLHARRDAAALVDVEKRSVEPVVAAPIDEVPVKIRKRNTKKCPAKTPSGSNNNNTNNSGNKPVSNVENGPSSPSGSSGSSNSQSRLDKIKSMYAFQGYVYAISSCKSKGQMTSDFKSMVSHKARTVITFGSCPSQDSTNDYENIIQAAQDAGIDVILLVDTLVTGSNSLYGGVIPRAKRIAQAIINKPNNVLAFAYGDEPLYDNDFGSPGNLASQIYNIKGQFKSAGLDIPISISDMGFGWQSAGQKSSGSSVAKAVDFFMINTFPYFGQSASWGGNDGAFEAFKNDISFFEGIAAGKPLLVTQTGWPSSTAEFAPNSNSIVATTGSEQAYWQLLDGHCSDYFKSKNLGWMWRDWNDDIQGWGVKDGSGNFKFNVDGVKTSC